MAGLEKERFYEYIDSDTKLVKKLKKYKSKLHYAKGRTKKIEEVRDLMYLTVEKPVETVDEAMDQLQMLAALEQERGTYLLQTRFLLFADFNDDILKAMKAFFPEDLK